MSILFDNVISILVIFNEKYNSDHLKNFLNKTCLMIEAKYIKYCLSRP